MNDNNNQNESDVNMATDDISICKHQPIIDHVHSNQIAPNSDNTTSNIIKYTRSNMAIQTLSSATVNTKNDTTDNCKSSLLVCNLPISLIAHILSYIGPLQVVRMSVLCTSFNRAIKVESSCFLYLHSVLFERLFSSHNRYPHNILNLSSYLKRFRSIRYLQITSSHILEMLKKMTNREFWNIWNRLRDVELVCSKNTEIHNDVILRTLETISFHEMRYTLNGLVLHNIHVNLDLFIVLSNLKTLYTLKLIGHIKFEDHTFNNNEWIYNNMDMLRTQIEHIHNISILFQEVHCVPYLFLYSLLHEHITSFSVAFNASYIVDIQSLMAVSNEYLMQMQSKCICAEMKILCITPHLYCDIDYDDTESVLSITREMFFAPHCFPNLEVFILGDWNNESWISIVSNRDFITFYQFIIHHHQTLHTLVFKNNTSSLLNVSMWEPINFLYNIFAKQYQFGDNMHEICRNKLQFWCRNTLRAFQFEISESAETFQQLISVYEVDDGIDFNIYLLEFEDAKDEWLDEIKFQLKELRKYFKQYNISHSIQLVFDDQTLELKPLFLNYLNQH